MSNGTDTELEALEGGVASDHPAKQTHEVLVGPTTSTHLNTVRAELIPVGCWRLEDLRFEFDSSIVLPEARKELKKLAALVKAHPGAPMSIFGHADPVGNDVYNKDLSGRRARAIYGLLTRGVDIWETLYNTKVQGMGDPWKYKAVQIMLKALGHDPGPITGTLTPATIQAVKSFQRANGLTDDGDPGPDTRGKLFPQYMDKICVDDANAPFKMAKSDFLAQGADSRGKGDFQGCSEFNPVLMFSSAENSAFQNPAKKTERDRENAPNRRVMALLFRPGSKVTPGKWPCPRADEGISGCQARFWSDAPTRRQFQANRRKFEDTKDTFACRFYQRMVTGSPCEGTQPPPPVVLITPLITPQTLIVVVKKPHTNPDRKPVTLRTSSAFGGNGTLTRSSEAARFFTAATGGTEITFNGVDNVFSGAQLTAGVTLHVEGATPSAAMNDITLTLTLAGGNVGPAAVATITSVALTLDICQSRTTTAADPTPMSEADKINVGRFVHRQDTGRHHGRAMLIVRQPQPSTFTGTLVLRAANNSVRLFQTEIAAAGQAAVATPRNIPAASIPADGLKFFVEGVTVSGALRDTGFLLDLQGVQNDVDHVQVTVVEFSNLRAVIPATQAKTNRLGNSPVNDHTLVIGQGPNPPASAYDEDFTTNLPLVLVEESLSGPMPTVSLTVQIAPAGVPFFWEAERDVRPAPNGDHADVIAASPQPTPTILNLNTGEGRLSDDAVGSFHVRAFVDCNGNNDFDGNDANNGSRIEREPFILMNLVLVRATLFQDDSQNHNTFTVQSDGANGIAVSSGSFNVNAPNTAASHLNAQLDLMGGGGDGRRGLDQVFAGWIQTLTADPATVATYDTVPPGAVQHFHRQIFASNRAAATGGTPGTTNAIFLPADPAPNIVAPPILDTGRNNAGTGGNTSTLTRSRIRTRTNLAVGQRLIVETVDSPGNGDPAAHAGFPGFLLTRYHFRFDFTGFLCVWTNRGRNIGATNDPAERLYSVALEVDWHLDGEWTIDPANGNITEVIAPTSQITRSTTHSPILPAVQTDVEVRPPTGLGLLCTNAQN
jgi:hypothetical protein